MELFVLDIVTIIMMVTLVIQFGYIFTLRSKIDNQTDRMEKMEKMMGEMYLSSKNWHKHGDE